MKIILHNFFAYLTITLVAMAVPVAMVATKHSLLTREIKTGVYGPRQCRADIDLYFTGSGAKVTVAADKALWRALDYMTKGSIVGHHNISDVQSWDYYMSRKTKYCGG